MDLCRACEFYFFIVETAGKTLEEMKYIFDAKNSSKETIKKTNGTVDGNGYVLHMESA